MQEPKLSLNSLACLQEESSSCGHQTRTLLPSSRKGLPVAQTLKAVVRALSSCGA